MNFPRICQKKITKKYKTKLSNNNKSQLKSKTKIIKDRPCAKDTVHNDLRTQTNKTKLDKD